jgi:hypothetical protein
MSYKPHEPVSYDLDDEDKVQGVATNQIVQCEHCGCMVGDEDQHTAWHRRSSVGADFFTTF